MILFRELEILSMQNKINGNNKSNTDIDQKEYFTRANKSHKNEFGDESADPEDEFKDIKNKIIAAQMTEEAEKESLKQLARLEKMHPDSSESAIIRNYLEWMVELPWSKESTEQIDLDKSLKTLNEDHFDLEKVKERILEYLAVKMLKGKEMKGPILCFAGPPGENSLGKSIVKAEEENLYVLVLVA